MFLIKTTLSHQLHLWILRLLWLRHSLTPDFFKRLAIRLGVAYLVIIAVQFLYPSRLAVPQARISGKYYGFQSIESIDRQLSELNNRTIKVNVAGTTLEKKLSDLGFVIDGQSTAKAAAGYNWKLRLIPFSILGVRQNIDSYHLSIDEDKLAGFAATLKQYDTAPINAAVAVEGSNLEVIPAVFGRSFDAEKVIIEVKDEGVDSSLTVNISPSIVEPPVPTKAAEQTKQSLQNRIESALSVEADGNILEIDPVTIASWVITTPDPQTGKLKIDYDREKIKTKLLELSAKIYIAESPNRVLIVDGQAETATNGSNGRALLMEETINEVVGALSGQATLVIAKMQDVTPSTQIARSYTRSSKGITALLAYWAESRSGQFGIFMKTIDGQIVAAYNPDKQFTSASIYKLYVAYIVYNKVEQGEISLEDSTSTGLTVGKCIEVMIVRSDNVCAVALGSKIGWSKNNDVLKSKGLTNTSLESLDQLTTANDVATWLFALQDGSLIKEENSKVLLSLMEKQIYRMGIPAGSDGKVANKIGDLYGLKHDAAIVYHPKGSYVLAVLTSGSSFSQISRLAREISDVMNQ